MRAALIALLFAATGCSIALQERPKTAPVAATKCAAGPWWIVDSIAVAASVAAFSYGATRSDDAGKLLSGVGALGGAVLLASAGNGYRWSRGCEAAQSASAVARR